MFIGPLVISLAGKKLLENEKTLLANKKVGGLVLFRENYDEKAEDPKEDLKTLIKEIRAINPNIVIMVDHEGGRVWRFTKGFTKLPSAQSYGDLYERNTNLALEKAFKDGFTMAKELRECGIDMSLTPVVDLDGPSNVIGKLERAYHKDPKIVIAIAEQFIQGMNKAGMQATLKHFPGHGTCALDSHIAAPIDDRSLEALQRDLEPFKTLISKDLVGAVMSNFVTYPAVDAKNVAAFSESWVKGCLRMGCGFNNVVMSDCLHMKGADVGENIKRLEAAQTAGNDFLMYTHQHDEKLDQLLSILDKVPDTKEAAERRSRLVSTMDRKEKLENTMLSQFATFKESVSSSTKDKQTLISTSDFPKDVALSVSNSSQGSEQEEKKPYSVT